MIPKKIHYCWFGGNPLPEDAVRYIETWKKHCPDYEIIEWNEDNFDISNIQYVREAYEAKKWAFVTDYVRLYALDQVGGIYMDTDVEVLKSLDPLLTEKGFSGFELENAVPTGIMAAEKGNPFIAELLRTYENLSFINEDGSPDLTTNVVRITKTAVDNGLKFNNSKQTVLDFTFYPKDYFWPKDIITGEILITDNTYTIHHFAGSWVTGKTLRRRIKEMLPVPIRKWLTKQFYRIGILKLK